MEFRHIKEEKPQTGKRITPVFTILLFLFITNQAWCGKIIYPWNATTAIVEAGHNFEIWLEATDGEIIESVLLQGPYNTVALPSFTVEEGFWVYDDMSGNTYNRKISVTVPEGTPEERYDLVLHTSKEKTVSQSAVKVIPSYKTEYSIFHISDTHLCDETDRKPGAAPRRLNHLSALVKTANILGAEIVFLTGDNVNSRSREGNNQDYLKAWPSTQERVDFFYKGSPENDLRGVYDFQGAAFAVNGNHDQYERPADGLETKNRFAFWNKYHGIRTHHFTYGNARFMAMSNAFGEDLNVQAGRHHAWLKETGSGNLRLVYQHIYNQVPENWFASDSIQLGLCGHNHHIGPQSPYKQGLTDMYIVNFTDYSTFNLFRVNANGEYSLVNNATAIENPKDDPADWVPKLSLSFENPNDGTSPVNSATLTSKFDFNIPSAHIRFIMPKGYEYTITNGSIYQQFDGDSVCVVDLRVPVGAGDSTAISIGSKPDRKIATVIK